MRVLCMLFLSSILISCKSEIKKETKVEENEGVEVDKNDALVPDADGWISLFDGSTTKHWHGFNKEGIGSGWKVENGELWFDPSVGDGGDIVTDYEFENFEFNLEWKIQECGNSGIMWNVQESPDYHSPWLTGPEMQILDNSCHPDAKIKTHRAGDLYDLIECSEETVKPAGEWNEVRIIQDQDDVQFWLNGVNVVSFTMHNSAWDEMVANSKFSSMPDFGKFRKGKISLQDHSDKVYFRNIRIKTL